LQINSLKKIYYDVKDGIGVHKTPDNYGAFPTDPYSHTPTFSGVQQPGLTGQVKEDIISRLGELGVRVKNENITFNISLINKEEFLSNTELFTYFDVNGEETEISIGKNSLAFTYCQVPIVYTLSNENRIIITDLNDQQTNITGMKLEESISKSIFSRNGKVKRLDVLIKY
jgi:hypothetical protein